MGPPPHARQRGVLERLFPLQPHHAPASPYESLEHDPAGTIRTIAEHLGETLPNAPSTETALVKQRTALNEEWRERFLRESGDLNRVDHKFARRVVPRTWRSFRSLLQGRLTAGPFPDPID